MNFRGWIALFLVLMLVGIGVYTYLFNFNQPLSEPKTQFNLSTPAVVKEIQQLQNLETASYTVEKIIEAGKEGNVFQDILYGDRILLIAYGRVVAGFDLSQITEKDVVVNGQILNINLPEPKILSTQLDNEKTRVYDRQSGFLTRGDKDLETQARQQAEISIRQAACESGLLTTAAQNGQKQLKVLFSSVGFATVNIQVPEATCN